MIVEANLTLYSNLSPKRQPYSQTHPSPTIHHTSTMYLKQFAAAMAFLIASHGLSVASPSGPNTVCNHNIGGFPGVICEFYSSPLPCYQCFLSSHVQLGNSPIDRDGQLTRSCCTGAGGTWCDATLTCLGLGDGTTVKCQSFNLCCKSHLFHPFLRKQLTFFLGHNSEGRRAYNLDCNHL